MTFLIKDFPLFKVHTFWQYVHPHPYNALNCHKLCDTRFQPDNFPTIASN